jgi:hypothetical protein
MFSYCKEKDEDEEDEDDEEEEEAVTEAVNEQLARQKKERGQETDKSTTSTVAPKSILKHSDSSFGLHSPDSLNDDVQVYTLERRIPFPKRKPQAYFKLSFKSSRDFKASNTLICLLLFFSFPKYYNFFRKAGV